MGLGDRAHQRPDADADGIADVARRARGIFVCRAVTDRAGWSRASTASAYAGAALCLWYAREHIAPGGGTVLAPRRGPRSGFWFSLGSRVPVGSLLSSAMAATGGASRALLLVRAILGLECLPRRACVPLCSTGCGAPDLSRCEGQLQSPSARRRRLRPPVHSRTIVPRAPLRRSRNLPNGVTPSPAAQRLRREPVLLGRVHLVHVAAPELPHRRSVFRGDLFKCHRRRDPPPS